MSRIGLVATALLVGSVGVTVAPPRAALPADAPDYPPTLRGQWQAVEAWWGAVRVPDEDVEFWRWDFGPGDPGAPRLAWLDPPAVVWPGPPHPRFAAPFETRRSPSVEGLWEIDLYASPFRAGGGTEGAYAFGSCGGGAVVRVRLAIDGRRPRPRAVDGFEPGYLTVELVPGR